MSHDQPPVPYFLLGVKSFSELAFHHHCVNLTTRATRARPKPDGLGEDLVARVEQEAAVAALGEGGSGGDLILRKFDNHTLSV